MAVIYTVIVIPIRFCRNLIMAALQQDINYKTSQSVLLFFIAHSQKAGEFTKLSSKSTTFSILGTS